MEDIPCQVMEVESRETGERIMIKAYRFNEEFHEKTSKLSKKTVKAKKNENLDDSLGEFKDMKMYELRRLVKLAGHKALPTSTKKDLIKLLDK